MPPYVDEEEESDKRKERRWNIPIPVRVKGTLGDGTSFEEETITSDASPSGMCVLLTRELRQGDRITIAAPEEQFEGAAVVRLVNPLGANMNRVRAEFVRPAKFGRQAAAKKYVYDYAMENWVGYMQDGTYYNSKHEPFGKIEGSTIVWEDSGKIIFRLKGDRVYDLRGNCIGHII